MQLYHAVTALFGLKYVSLQISKLKASWKLVSRYYLMVLSSSSTRMERVARQWQSDIPSLTEEGWVNILITQLSMVISARG